MLPGFTAGDTVYRSCRHYIGNAGGMPGAGDLVPAATNVCVTSNTGQTQCTAVSGVGEGVLWGALIGSLAGPAGTIIGGIIGGIYCWLKGCD